MPWAIASNLVSRLLDWSGGIVYEFDYRVSESELPWPVIFVEATVINNSKAPVYAYGLDVEPPFNGDMLSLALKWKPNEKHHSVRGNSLTFDEASCPVGTKLSLDFILYPNWQKLDMELSQPHLGLSGQSAGMVATFHSRLLLRSKADRRLPNVTTRQIKIDAAIIAAMAKKAETLAGDKALSPGTE